LKRAVGIAHTLGIVLHIIITLPNQIVQLLRHTRIQRCPTHHHALMAVKGIAYGFEMRCERLQSVMDAACMCSYGVIGRDNPDNHKQGGDAWDHCCKKARIAQLSSKTQQGTHMGCPASVVLAAQQYQQPISGMTAPRCMG